MLTTRELEVLGLLSAGARPKEIARELVISPKTVASHIQRVLAKLGAHSRAEAVAIAYREGFVKRPRSLTGDDEVVAHTGAVPALELVSGLSGEAQVARVQKRPSRAGSSHLLEQQPSMRRDATYIPTRPSAARYATLTSWNGPTVPVVSERMSSIPWYSGRQRTTHSSTSG